MARKQTAAAVKAQPPTIAVIGAGRLGSALALALSQQGYHVAALVARRAAHARQSARLIKPAPLALGSSQLESLPDTDIVFITTPDDQIAGVAAYFAQSLSARAGEMLNAGASKSLRVRAGEPLQKRVGAKPRRRRVRIALHASGALSSDELSPLRAHGFSVGSLHPLAAISDAATGAQNLRGAFYCLEGETGALRAARQVVRALEGHSFALDMRRKPLYHAAAVITSGHTVALFDLAVALLVRCGLTPKRAREVLLPLLAGTLDNLRARATTAEALTGTFARADLSTVRQHLPALADADTPGALAIYALLGERALRMAAGRKQFEPSVVAAITLLLESAVNKDSAE